ncbi:MAG: PAS domain-containing protein [Rhizobiales bacterium]|nr:PAS domain-containing protein [Hyphomicrobiales bacterium]
MAVKDDWRKTQRGAGIGGAGVFVFALAALVLAVFVVLDVLTLGNASLALLIGLGIASVATFAGRAGDNDIAPFTPRAANQALSQSSDISPEAIVAAFPDPVVALDRQGRVVAYNARANAIAPALRAGEHGSIALRNPELVTAIRRVGETGEVQHVEYAERVPADRWLEAFVTPVPASSAAGNGRTNLVLVTFHDLTPLRRMEVMRADFVANASHELRTPLAALSGFIETLRGPARDDPSARDRFLGIMQAQANRMARLIDDLLSLSRIELNAHLHPETPVDLLAIVRQVVDSLQTLAADREVKITITPPQQSLIVPGDRDELIRIFENLVENALKYGASGKRVDISCRQVSSPDGKQEALVAVRDYGPGISAEHMPRLTERFYRVDVSESRAQGGTGLGLALVKHILNRHGGRLAIDSKPGEGATFTVRLPLATGRHAAD